MEKSADAFRSIGEMAEELNVRTHILRYWEEQFPMLKPLKRAGGRRHYRPEDVALLLTIHRLLNSEGYTIKGALKFLGSRAAGAAPAAQTPAMPVSAPVAQFDVAALRAVRDRLSAALAAA
ncbi:MAG: MerR family transcriptional regulator [Sphingorhabdus sp.]